MIASVSKTKGNVFHLNSDVSCFVAKVDDSWLWHKRLCHINFDNIVKISNFKVVRDLPSIARPVDTICRECVMGNHVRSSFRRKKNLAKNKLDLVHTDLCGPTQTRS